MANSIVLLEVICDNNNNDDGNDKNDNDNDDDHGDNDDNKNISNQNNDNNKNDCLSQCIQFHAFSVLCSNFSLKWLQQIPLTFLLHLKHIRQCLYRHMEIDYTHGFSTCVSYSIQNMLSWNNCTRYGWSCYEVLNCSKKKYMKKQIQMWTTWLCISI